MTSSIYLFIAMLGVAAAFAWLVDAARVLFRYRGKMLFTCPETGKTVCVKVAAADAARSSLSGRPKIHLSECFRWPERQSCGQECLTQLGADPHNCLVWTKVVDWYRGRSCAIATSRLVSSIGTITGRRCWEPTERQRNGVTLPRRRCQKSLQRIFRAAGAVTSRRLFGGNIPRGWSIAPGTAG